MQKLRKRMSIIMMAVVFAVTGMRIHADECLKRTLVTPHMEVPIPADQNVVYCSTFQIAWSRLKEDIIKEDIRVKRPVAIVPYLDKSLSTEADISAGDYLALAGFVKDDIIGNINRGLKDEFGFDAMLVDGTRFKDPTTIVAFSFLNKNLDFEHSFEEYKQPMAFYTDEGRESIEGFGVYKYSSKPEHQKIKEQVEVLDYVSYRDFIIRLNSKATDDEIILAKVVPGATLLDTFKNVQARVAAGKPKFLGKNDILQIPKFDLAMSHSYSSLLGVHLANKGFEGYFFAEAAQRLNFRLDESGAKVKSDAIIVLKKGSVIDFRVLMLNSSFLLYIKKKDGRYPYLMMWIDNAELLVKSGGHGASAGHTK